jgi:hypothetical protein
MTKITLTRQQIKALHKIIKLDKTLESVIITETRDLGIGPTVVVEYTVKQDITDTRNW